MNHSAPACDQAEAELEVRAATYLLLARLLRAAPSEALLQELVRNRLLTVIERAGHPAAATGALSDPVEDPRWPAQAQAIAVEHARLLAVPGEFSIRAYESVYCDTVTIDNSTGCSVYFPGPSDASEVTGLLHGPSAVAVREAYQGAGFAVDPASHELPDHLAVELEFMGRLLEHGMGRQAADFFQAHLGRWAFRCLHDIKRHAQLSFYRAIAAAAETFLRTEEAAFTPMAARHSRG